ncbi:hypothetical protein CAPN001_08680 [Capnocytophaga stomatis]|uniref:AAA family ATPase n=1 Tax=Capnocytophaga stomatis TaxID=1848904 RepID=UPI0019515E94|nr:ATP-binding protein [Capnocytophaga stomatis]GIJ96299.1 hypothetical protein CAPN001_08680 [Capnocytophaga stomatis]
MEKKFEQIKSEIIRVAFVGPECTGKTTLSQTLANDFQTEWVPEFMRTYLQKKWDEKRETCTWDDLEPIALGQILTENELIQKANKIIFCDTNLLELMIYSYIYYEKCPAQIEKYAIENHYDIIFLTNIDVPWQADDLRDKPNEREFMFSKFKQMLDEHNIKYVVITGNLEERLKTVKEVVYKILKNND